MHVPYADLADETHLPIWCRRGILSQTRAGGRVHMPHKTCASSIAHHLNKAGLTCENSFGE